MDLREYLEGQIAEDIKLRKEYEDELRYEADPGRKGKLKARIEELKQRVHEHEEELRSLSVSSVQPESVMPYPSSTATPASEPKQEVKPPTQPPPTQATASSLPKPKLEEVESEEPKEVELRSERGIDYTQLRDLLAAGKWQEADEETTRVICQAAGRTSEHRLREEDIDNFPCEDLRTINQLWLHYSKGKFGFSVQKEIYESLHEKRGQSESRWEKFGDRVGWRSRGNWRTRLTYDLELASLAHLPSPYSGHFTILQQFYSHRESDWLEHRTGIDWRDQRYYRGQWRVGAYLSLLSRKDLGEIAAVEKRLEDLKLLQVFEFDVVTVEVQRTGLLRLGSKVTFNLSRSQARYFTEDLGNGVTLAMVAIPGGTFQMGSPEGEGYYWEKPQHQVKVQPFFIGKYPVTQAQWRAIASLPQVNHKLDPDPSHFKPPYYRGDNHPIHSVSWYDAVEFCERLSRETRREYRLPSEAEWEYACRAGTTTPFYFGGTITYQLANYDARKTYASEPKGVYRGEITLVGSFPPNAFGLYDMHGLVWEWCADNWHDNADNYEGAPDDGSAWLSSNQDTTKLLRGGSWNSPPNDCRSAYRKDNSPDDRSFNIGFRVVCVAPRTT